jgi:ferredoxin/flavodoxin---NADP+ reductase
MVPNTPNARITDLIENRELERTVGLAIDDQRSRIMICGNAKMIDEPRAPPTTRGLTVSRPGAPGHPAVENYLQSP